MNRSFFVLSLLITLLCNQTIATNPDDFDEASKRRAALSGSYHPKVESLPKTVDFNRTILFLDKLQLGIMGLGVSAYYAHKIDWRPGAPHIAKHGIVASATHYLRQNSSMLSRVGVSGMVIYAGSLVVDIYNREKRITTPQSKRNAKRTPPDWGAGI